MAKTNKQATMMKGGMSDEKRAEKQRLDEQMKRLREARQSRNKKIIGMQEKLHQDAMRKKMMSKGGGVDKFKYEKGQKFNDEHGEIVLLNKYSDELWEARRWSGMRHVGDVVISEKDLDIIRSRKMKTGGGVGKKGRYHILGALEGKQPVLYSATDDKNDISKLVKLADKDFFDLTGKKHKIFVTDSVADEEIYHYGNGGGVDEKFNYDGLNKDLVDKLKLLVTKKFTASRKSPGEGLWYIDGVQPERSEVAMVTFNRKDGWETPTPLYIEDVEMLLQGKKNWIFKVAKEDKMQTGGGVDDYTKNLARVKVKFANPKYNYETSVSGEITEQEARKYFVGQTFDMGVYPKENMQKVIDIEFFAKGTYEQGGGVDSKKVYYQMSGVGSSKYVVNFHDGKKTHKDGSPFFDIEIFKNKVDLKKFIDKLHQQGYVQSHEHGGKMAFGGMVNDLPEHVIERMDGLVLNDELDRFLYATEAIVKDMENEGFEKDETLSFLASKMVQAAKDMYKTGGYVKGDDIVFNRYDESTEGTIHEKLDDGNFVVYTDNGVILVEPRDITGRAKKRLFGIFNNGGNVASGAAHIYVVLENGDIKVYHGDDRKSLLFEKRNAPAGSWEKIWECLRKL